MADPRPLRVGVDIGGTFTDLAVLDDRGIVAVGKTLTTHREPAAAVEQVLRQTLEEHRLDPAAITTVVHGTTLVTNALIERRGARTALLTTEGFRDVVEMGREHRYELYDLGLELPRPLVPRHLRFGVRERLRADGTVLTPLDVDTVRRLGVELAAAGVTAVAVCFLHSHTNGEHERRAREVLDEVAPELRVALSCEVNPEIREYERTSTTLANVYVQQLVETYLADLRERLRRCGVRTDPLIMLSHGGVAALETARRFPIRMLESGPAGGALGAVAFGRAAGRPDQLAFDMGGTTAKLCVVERHRPLVTHTFEVDRVYRLRAGSGLPVRAPVIDMIEIGTGGGSIARVDPLGLITVGPDSAGSEPGPVCYGRGGTRCTVTDADVVLGYLDPARFLGGEMDLDAAAAEAAVKEQIAEPLGVSVAEAAWGVHTTANENMANAARVHAVERGQDPGRLPVFVSGGNGPLHGPGVARALGAPAVVAPPAAGVLSALGFLSAPMSIDIVRSRHALLSELDVDAAAALFAEMAREGTDVLVASGVSDVDVTCERTLEMRYVGQGGEIEVPVPPPDGPGWRDAVLAAFRDQYAQRFGTVAPSGVEPELLTWRVTASGPRPRAHLGFESTSDGSGALLGHRDAYFAPDGYRSTAVYDRYRLAPGTVLEGPALVEEREATLLVPPGARCSVEADSSIVVDFTAGGPR
ncbi:hydantoinase/oxoprolinase family protein [Saccharopolyspora hordei]|uniref:N-methylhydantoinase A n=1 Tax=Saccharopolyspora hordei TaxID=1838 RepID=A0A853AHR4_9PSEU|nr:hydantoinase/oxoprolinase family protein [Saccharopolyspora hordei]NYI83665.1 N-methylhydantoinase A [Saccharopolyspora hordei]